MTLKRHSNHPVGTVWIIQYDSPGVNTKISRITFYFESVKILRRIFEPIVAIEKTISIVWLIIQIITVKFAQKSSLKNLILKIVKPNYEGKIQSEYLTCDIPSKRSESFILFHRFDEYVKNFPLYLPNIKY